MYCFFFPPFLWGCFLLCALSQRQPDRSGAGFFVVSFLLVGMSVDVGMVLGWKGRDGVGKELGSVGEESSVYFQPQVILLERTGL